MKIKIEAFLYMALFSIIFSACGKDAASSSITLLEAAGGYTLNGTSYSVPLNSNGQEVTSSKTSLQNEKLTVVIGKNDSLYFDSKNLGYANGKAVISGQIITVTIANQIYTGINQEPFAENTIKSEDPVIIEKKDGKFSLKGSVFISRGATRSRVRFVTDFK